MPQERVLSSDWFVTHPLGMSNITVCVCVCVLRSIWHLGQRFLWERSAGWLLNIFSPKIYR